MFDETTPGAVWSARPSVRALVVSLVAMLVIIAAVWNLVPFAVKAVYEATPSLPFWSYESILLVQSVIKWVLLAGIPINLWKIFLLWSVRYEVTADRFMYHHGILVRRHDQIELQRIRDFQVISPLFSRAIGLGKVWMVARDESCPELTIGPFVDAAGVRETIRTAVISHQQRTGYREFEANPGG